MLAFALLIGGVLLAVESMSVEDQMRSHYEDALALSHLALEAQQASAQLRNEQLRAARGVGQMTLLAPARDMGQMQAAAANLGAKLDKIGSFPLSPEEARLLTELKNTLKNIGELSARFAETRQRDDGNVSTAELATLSEQRFEAFSNSLSALVGAVRTRTVAAARRADDLNLVARYALIAFSAVTLALGVLSILLTLRRFRENRSLLGDMQQLVHEDALTGAINRRGLEDAMPVEFSRAQRSEQPLTLVMLDLDHFKRYNDRRGHPAGDALLRGAAQAWRKQLRPTDMLVRYGGEEFTLVLPRTDADEAAHLVDRLRALVPDRQTFSAGIATWDGSETATEVLQRADQALLQAKKAGRNRTMVAGREPQVTLPLLVA
ncbi:MAG TPA: diguanylate cyclase [Burkholderiaceae bacterium]|nr:diguanylate cyclase [Burkholderiaceae bacterium]